MGDIMPVTVPSRLVRCQIDLAGRVGHYDGYILLFFRVVAIDNAVQMPAVASVVPKGPLNGVVAGLPALPLEDFGRGFLYALRNRGKPVVIFQEVPVIPSRQVHSRLVNRFI